MKSPFQRLIIVTIGILVILPSLAISQDKPTVVVSSFMIKLSDRTVYIEDTDKYWVPAFDKLVDEGKLLSWGYLTHDLGDEWNFVFHYTAKDFASYESAWQEGLATFLDSKSEEDVKTLPMIQAHKDNIYTGQHFYDGKPLKTE
ncbi:MAG: hypothetical protein V3U16_03445 [Candidatus Neomarinimicrobiota bacterium]